MGFAILGGVGAATSLAGSLMGANAAQSAAKAQEAAAGRYQQFVQQQSQKAQDLVGNPTDMAAYDKALKAQEGVVNRQETLAQSLEPNLIDIGKQLHGLLNGQSAPVLDNLKQQRGLQRQQLVSQLQTQMGPGAETSSAGSQALNQFDQETSNLLSQTQQQVTQQFMGASLSSPDVINALGGANKDLAGMQQLSPQARQAQIMAQFTGAQGQAASMEQQAAGAGAVSQQFLGQGLSQLGQLGTTLGTLGASGAFNKGAPGASGTNPAAGFKAASLSTPEVGSQFSPGTFGNAMGMSSAGSQYSLGANTNFSPPAVNYSGGP